MPRNVRSSEAAIDRAIMSCSWSRRIAIPRPLIILLVHDASRFAEARCCIGRTWRVDSAQIAPDTRVSIPLERETFEIPWRSFPGTDAVNPAIQLELTHISLDRDQARSIDMRRA